MTDPLQERLQTILSKLVPGALQLLQQMVQINSFTANAAGVNDVGRLTAAAFEPLGFAPEFVPSENPAFGKHLILSRPGKSNRTIGLITHLDTVFPAEEEIRNRFSWREADGRIYGPGVIDIKGGTVMIHLVLSALQGAVPEIYDQVRWIVCANSSEETLSTDFSALCLQRLGPSPMAALVFEVGGKSGPNWTLVTGRKGRATFHVRVTGRGAHAGSQHHRGANAAVALALLIEKIAGLTDYSKDLTFNVGVVSAGTVVNRVPHEACAEVEMRAFSVDAFESGKRAILNLSGPSPVRSAEDGFPCSIEILAGEEIMPWPPNPATDQLFQIWRDAGHRAGSLILPEQRGGISDGNFLWNRIPTMDGLGPHGDNSHSSESSPDGAKVPEYLEPDSFLPKALLNAMALCELLKKG